MLFTKLFMTFICSLLFFSNSAKALPELKAKQAIENLRYISDDGKITYYTRRSGQLQLSTNYSFNTVVEGEKGTNYLLQVSTAKKEVLIEKINNPGRVLNFFKDHEILSVPYGSSKKAKKIGFGVATKLHLDDQWISFYQHKTKQIILMSLRNQGSSKKIKPLNSQDKFFIPDVVMITANDILYTDINNAGYTALLHYSLIENKFITMYKSRYSGSKLEFCRQGESIYIGEFSKSSGSKGSLIIKMPLYNNKGFNQSEIIYSSRLSDIGNMSCSKSKIYFSKTIKFTPENQIRETEIASLNLKENNKVTVLSKMKYLTQTLKMDSLVLTPFKGKYYIVDGKKDIINDEIEKKK